MATVVLSTVTVTTDAYAVLSLDEVTFTTISLSWKNVSPNAAIFRIMNDVSQDVSGEISVDAGKVGSLTISALSPGTTHKYYLERYELDSWVPQTSTTSTDFIEVSTYDVTGLTITTSSTSANIVWNSPVSSQEFTVTVGRNSSPNEILQSYQATTSSAILSDLDQGVSYIVQIIVTENDQDFILVAQTFTTSSAAAMVVVEGPMASYIVLDWTDSVDGKGSNYRIMNRKSGSDTVLAESSTDTLVTIKDLIPGSSYVFVLQRLELDGTWDDQTEVSTTTLSSSMSLLSVGSTTLELSWTPISENSEYEIQYSPFSGGSSSSSGRTYDLKTSLRDLSPGTNYTTKLITYELGEAVGLASLGALMYDSVGSSASYGVGIVLTKLNILASVFALVLILILVRRKQ